MTFYSLTIQTLQIGFQQYVPRTRNSKSKRHSFLCILFRRTGMVGPYEYTHTVRTVRSKYSYGREHLYAFLCFFDTYDLVLYLYILSLCYCAFLNICILVFRFCQCALSICLFVFLDTYDVALYLYTPSLCN